MKDHSCIPSQLHPFCCFLLPPKQGWFEMKNNTSVYVTGLPFDTDEKEVAAVFSKCGILKEGPDAQPRIKLYRCLVLLPFWCCMVNWRGLALVFLMRVSVCEPCLHACFCCMPLLLLHAFPIQSSCCIEQRVLLPAGCRLRVPANACTHPCMHPMHPPTRPGQPLPSHVHLAPTAPCTITHAPASSAL